MTIKKLFIIAALLGVVHGISAQKTGLFTDSDRQFKKGLEFYEKGLFSAAMHEFKIAQGKDFPIHREASSVVQAKAHLMEAACLIRMDIPEGQQKMALFLRHNPNNPVAVEGIIEIASYHYNSGNYPEAIQFFEMVNPGDLPNELSTEVSFKMGYSHFAQQNFQSAMVQLFPILEDRSIYYYPANYYYGMSAYFTGDQQLALDAFQRVESSGYYGKLVPYYIGAINFKDEKYDDLIEELTPYATDTKSRYSKESYLILGQAHFERENYVEAAQYLEEGISQEQSDQAGLQYQLGFSHYQNGDYQKAIPHLQKVALGQDEISQNANFYLAECYMKTDDLESARNVLANAVRYDHNEAITEEAKFNYGKLSAQLQYDRQAVNSLISFDPSSVYFAQAQEVLAEVLLNSKDYARAIEIIEEIESPPPPIRRAYQKVTYLRATQLFNDLQLDAARSHFDKSLENPLDQSLRAQALFWKAEISHRDRKFQQSIEELNQFFTVSRSGDPLPEISSSTTANYLQGYNYLKLGRHEVALGFFQEAVSSIRLNTVNIEDPFLKNQILSDAMLRAGDCLFKNNRYSQALRFYNDAIEMGHSGHDYAIYQKSLIQGLTGKPFEKIVLLEDLLANHPNSAFADDALLQMGLTFQELGRSSDAVQALERLTREHTKTSPLVNKAQLRLGLIHYNQGDLPSAIHHYEQVFKNNPDKSEAQDALAALEEIYVNDLGQPEQYFSLVESIGIIDFSDYARDSLTFRSAEMQYMSGNYDRAINSYTTYIQQFSRGAFLVQAFYNRAESYAIQRRWEKALNDYEFVVNRGAGIYYLRAVEKAAAISYHHSEDFQRAFQLYKILQTAATSEEQRFEAQLGALRSAFRIKHIEGVNEMAELVLQNERANEEHRALAHFFQGKMHYDQKLFSRALENFNKVIRMTDNLNAAESRYLIAQIYLLQNEIELAGEMGRLAVQENSNYPKWVAKSLILLADVLILQDDTFNAKAALEAVVEHFDEDPDIVNEAQLKLKQISERETTSDRESDNQTETEGSPLKMEEPIDR